MSFFLDVVKIVGVLVSVTLLFGPRSFSNIESIYAVLAISEFKYAAILLICVVLFFDKIILYYVKLLKSLQNLLHVLEILIKIGRKISSGYLLLSLCICAFGFGVFSLGIGQLLFTQARAAKHIQSRHENLIRQRIVDRYNVLIKSGRTVQAKNRLQDIVKLFPDDFRNEIAKSLIERLDDIHELSKKLTEIGRAQSQSGFYRSAANSFRYAQLIDPINETAKIYHDRLVAGIDETAIKDAAARWLNVCKNNVDISNVSSLTKEMRSDLSVLRPYYTENVEVPNDRLFSIFCFRGIAGAQHFNSNDLPIKAFQPIVQGLARYKDADQYVSDIKEFMKARDLVLIGTVND